MMSTLWAPRIYTRQGFVRENILGSTRALDIGCGGRKLPGAIGVDILAKEGVDIIHDLSLFPWPFEDRSFELVLANHFLEHAADAIKTLEEIHRILVPNGRVVIQVPYFRSTDAFTDPTHRHFFTSHTLNYAVQRTDQSSYGYTSACFEKCGFWYGWPHVSRNPFTQALKNAIHRHPDLYDQYLSLLFPTKCLTWELGAVK